MTNETKKRQRYVKPEVVSYGNVLEITGYFGTQNLADTLYLSHSTLPGTGSKDGGVVPCPGSPTCP